MYSSNILFTVCVLWVSLASGGCATTTYHDYETPRGTVSPVPADQSATPHVLDDAHRLGLYRTTHTPHIRATAGLDQATPKPEVTRDISESGFDPDMYQLDAEEFTRTFATAFQNQGKPRMLVYLGRELNGEVREWIVRQKLVTPRGEYYESFNNHVDLTPRASRYIRTVLEKGFADRFRAAGVPMIDLRVIVRNKAVEFNQEQSDGALSTRQVESLAAAENAEIMVEIMIGNTHGRNQLLARATEISSGKQLGQTGWLDPSDTVQYRKTVISSPRAGPDGWVFEQQVLTEEVYRAELADLGDILAVEMMKTILSTWK